MQELDSIDKKLLNILQNDFPVVEKPFEDIAVRLDITEEDVIEKIKSLKNEKKIIRRVGAVFDTKRLGYQSSLAAFKVSEKDIDKVAEIVNGHPGVSHNYKRDCEYNLWFTIAVPPGHYLEGSFKRLRFTEITEVDYGNEDCSLRLLREYGKKDHLFCA